ncbi:MAG: peptide chain release factor aRF-1 [Candidatus Freyarchaeota archaeon]|nr:peptide chain release factor aRF-1 [Candidatus Freyrarchaeum guaymaensis]
MSDEEAKKRTSFEKYRLRRLIEVLESKKGAHTELISLYIPPGKVISDVTNYLKQEYGTAANIKSKATRKNVMEAIRSIISKLKYFQRAPSTGLVIFSGAVPTSGQGTEKLEFWMVTPPEPINIYKYHCDSKFYLEPLKDLLEEKDTYGVIVLDRSEAHIATIKGTHLEIHKKLTSGIPGKHSAGGQSQRRFERLIEQAGHEFFKRVGEHANEVFLSIPDLKGIVIGGPGPSKEKFVDGDYLDYRLKQKIIGVVDIGYTGEPGIEELVGKAESLFEDLRYTEEKRLVQKFLEMLVKNDEKVAYGEREVREALLQGRVDTLLLSEGLDILRVTIRCPNCGYSEEKTVMKEQLQKLQEEVAQRACPVCNSSLLTVEEVRDVIEELGELGEQTGARVEVISTETEEGQQLKQAFKGVAAILRY